MKICVVRQISVKHQNVMQIHSAVLKLLHLRRLIELFLKKHFAGLLTFKM
jgi:hypothetical protein